VERDWLQQLCLVNIDDCTEHERNIYFTFIWFQQVRTGEMKSDKCWKKHLFDFISLIKFRVKCTDGLRVWLLLHGSGIGVSRRVCLSLKSIYLRHTAARLLPTFIWPRCQWPPQSYCIHQWSTRRLEISYPRMVLWQYFPNDWTFFEITFFTSIARLYLRKTLQIFQLSLTMTTLCHFKRDHLLIFHLPEISGVKFFDAHYTENVYWISQQ